MQNIANKVVIITGASSGIGEATARKLAAEGAKLVLGARREDKLNTIAASIRADGGEAVYRVTDVTRPEDSAALVALAKSTFGKIDAIFLNAGLMPNSPLAALETANWNAMIDVNIKGVLHGVAAVLPDFTAQKSGHIITTSSVAGLKAYPGAAVYCGTKWAVKAIMEALRMESAQAGSNIRTATIYPAAVQGQQAPAELIAAIGAAESRQECDVLLVVRGGGSFEDLDAFNHEGLVRRLAGCSLPVVSGVGHESDFTLTDFVADVRAPTPTAAAELVSPDRRQALQQLAHRGHRLAAAMQRQFERLAQRLDMAERMLRSPGQQLQVRHQRLAQLAGRLSQAMTCRLPSPQQRLERQTERLQRSMTTCLADSRNRLQRGETLLRAPQAGPAAFRLQRAEERLAQAAGLNWQRAAQRLDRAETSLGLISPLAVLGRGYAIVRDEKGRLLASAADAATGQPLDVQLRDGRLAVTVDAVRPA